MQEEQIITLRGGLDMVTPAIQRDPGSLIACDGSRFSSRWRRMARWVMDSPSGTE